MIKLIVKKKNMHITLLRTFQCYHKQRRRPIQISTLKSLPYFLSSIHFVLFDLQFNFHYLLLGLCANDPSILNFLSHSFQYYSNWSGFNFRVLINYKKISWILKIKIILNSIFFFLICLEIVKWQTCTILVKVFWHYQKLNDGPMV